MARRLYLDTADFTESSPAYAAGWEHESGASRRKLTPTAPSSTYNLTPGTTTVNGSGVAGEDTLSRAFYIRLGGSGTLTGTVKGQIMAREANANTDARIQRTIRILSSDGTTVRGTALDFDTGALANEFVTSSTNSQNARIVRAGSASLSSVAWQHGDLLVYEVGFRNHGTNTGVVTLGVNGTVANGDLPEDETTRQADGIWRPWIELSQDFPLYEEVATPGVIDISVEQFPAIAGQVTVVLPGVIDISVEVLRATVPQVASPLLGIVQLAEKVTVTRRYRGVDTIEVVIDERTAHAHKVTLGRVLYLPRLDFSTPLAFLVEQIERDDTATRRQLILSGRTMDGIALADRLALPAVDDSHDRQTNVPAETAMKHYVEANAGASAATARQVPQFVVATTAGRGSNVTVAARYQRVLDVVLETGYSGGLGWKVSYEAGTGRHTFEVIEPADRTDRVFFDFDFGMLERWREVETLLDSKTLAVVAGQGEGVDREIVVRPEVEPEGLDRREAFIDARDVDLGNTDVLNQRGDAFLSAASATQSLSVTPRQFGAFAYSRDWFLGDFVLLRNTVRGISRPAQVVGVEFEVTKSAAVPTIRAILDRAEPTLRGRIEGPFAGGAVDQGSGGEGGGEHPNLATHDAMGLATDAELAAHHHDAAYQPLDADLTSIASLTTTSFGRALLELANAAGLRTAAELGALATLATVGTSQIDNDAVTYAKMQNVSATSRLLGRKTASAGDAEEVTMAEALAFLLTTRGDIIRRGSSAPERLAIGGRGTVLASDGTDAAWGEVPFIGCTAVRTATQSLTSGSATAVLFTAADEEDTDDFHSTSSNTDRITIPTGLGGLYDIIGGAQFASNSTGGRAVALTLNSTALTGSLLGAGSQFQTNGSVESRGNAMALRVSLAQGDIIRMVVRQDSGGSLNLTGARLTVRKVG